LETKKDNIPFKILKMIVESAKKQRPRGSSARMHHVLPFQIFLSKQKRDGFIYSFSSFTQRYLTGH